MGHSTFVTGHSVQRYSQKLQTSKNGQPHTIQILRARSYYGCKACYMKYICWQFYCSWLTFKEEMTKRPGGCFYETPCILTSRICQRQLFNKHHNRYKQNRLHRVSTYLPVTLLNCAKTAERIEVQFGLQTRGDLRNSVLAEGPNRPEKQRDSMHH